MARDYFIVRLGGGNLTHSAFLNTRMWPESSPLLRKALKVQTRAAGNAKEFILQVDDTQVGLAVYKYPGSVLRSLQASGCGPPWAHWALPLRFTWSIQAQCLLLN